jgi:mono/diheme cytochrome c family protein
MAMIRGNQSAARVFAVTLSPYYLVAWSLLIAGCDLHLPGRPDPADKYQRPDAILDFAALYKQNCAGCHGANGTLGPAPPLNDDLFRTIVPLEELVRVLNHGRPGTPMTAFARPNGGPLTEPQIQILVHEIKGIPYRVVRKVSSGKTAIEVVSGGHGSGDEVVREVTADALAWGVPPERRDAPPYLSKDAPAGKPSDGLQWFSQACASCHGSEGRGWKRDDEVIHRINDRDFLALISNQALRRYVLTGRSDLGMPNWADRTDRPGDFEPLTAQQISDLVELLASWRRGEGMDVK